MKKEVWVNLGCGIHLLKGFINVDNGFDLEDLKRREGIYRDAEIDDGATFLKADMRSLPLPDNYADYMLSHYSIEHIPLWDVVDTLKEWKRVLKPTGELAIYTLDFDNLMMIWQLHAASDRPNWEIGVYYDIAQQIYGNQIQQGEYHFCPFNFNAMNHMLAAAEFPEWNIQVIPNNTPYPKIKGYPYGAKDMIQRYGEIHVKARKTSTQKGVQDGRKNQEGKVRGQGGRKRCAGNDGRRAKKT